MRKFVFGISFLTLLLTYSAAKSPIVRTSKGLIEGETITSSVGQPVDRFLGIPYAKPPVGPLRFKHPVATEPWNGFLEAKTWPKSCPQLVFKISQHLPGFKNFWIGTPTSEDCLYLNVWIPSSKSSQELLPVMVYLHGGAFTVGSAASVNLDPINLASVENVVVVTVNYRLGVFGFIYLDHPSIDTNSGLMDQVEALKWVQSNIAAFGGNPKEVTIFGQSAGSISAGFHLISPFSKNLFKRVIMESGAPFGEWAHKDKNDMEKKSYELLENLECPNVKSNLTSAIECLMGANFEDIVSNVPILDYKIIVFYPYVDGHFLPDTPKVLFEKGNFQKVDILLGSMKNEGSFLMSTTEPLKFDLLSDVILDVSEEEQYELITNLFPKSNRITQKAIRFQYNVMDKRNIDVVRAMDSVIGDSLFLCGSKRLADYYSAESSLNVFIYYFVHRASNSDWAQWVGVTHGDEIDYVFGNFYKNDSTWYNKQEKEFGKQIMRYWTNFARTGNPNTNPSPIKKEVENNVRFIEELNLWPKYTPKNRLHFVLAPNSSAVLPNFKEKQCWFWNHMVPYYGSLKLKD